MICTQFLIQVKCICFVPMQISCIYKLSYDFQCPPCKAFTPLLVKLYRKLQSSEKKFEVIFVSSDRSEESFVKYFSTMPWTAVPYAEEKARKELAHFYGVGGKKNPIVRFNLT